MTPGRRKNPREPVPAKAPVGSEGKDRLFTSGDLFGDMVDEVLPETMEPSPAPTRKVPIRVQVSEPEAPVEKAATAPEKKAAPPPEPAQELPADVAAMLDNVLAPAPPPTDDELPPDVATLLDNLTPVEDAPKAPIEPDVPAKVESPRLPETRRNEPAERPAPQSRSPRFARTSDHDQGGATGFTPGVPEAEDSLIEIPELLEAGPEHEAPPSKVTADSLLELPEFQKVEEDPVFPEDIPVAFSPRGAKFQAAAPKPDSEAGAGFDLAALADDAVGEGLASGATSPRRRLPAHTYGPYQLLDRIAAGGMAEVFRAKRTGVEGFEKMVAVKRILPHLSDNKEFVDMFVNEAKMVAGLTHPNIVQIFDLGKIETTYYIAMEHVHGRDLRSILKRAKERGLKIPLDLSVLIVSKVCLALEYAHRKKDDRGEPMRIVHRDISPQNILISFEGEVKLTDFGIARAASKARTTDAGALRGKLLYMSPEQAWGKAVDCRSDVFSLAVVFYEMLTEQKPFLGGSETSILEMVRECNVASPTSHNPRIPESIERVVMKALSRDPDSRYADAGTMYRDLDRVLHERQPPAATDLARFMEVLFEPNERGDTVHEEPRTGPRPGAEGSLDVEFDASGSGPRPPAAAQAPKEEKSLHKLLKRMGLK